MAAAVLASTASAAHAGAYVGLGIGPTPAMSDDVGSQGYLHADGRALRVGAGYRFSNLSIEGAVTGVNGLTQVDDETIYVGWAAMKLSIPLSNGFEVFGRVGLDRQQMNAYAVYAGNTRTGLSGNGFLVGAGFEYNLNLVATKASIYVDYNLAYATLEDSNGYIQPIDNTVRQWTLGISVGL